MLLFNYCSNATFCLDSLLGSSREGVGGDGEGLVQFAATENLDAVLGGNQTVLTERLEGELGDVLGFGKRIEQVEVDTYVLNTIDVLEAELGQTTIDGHLATFETYLLVITRTGFGTLVTTGGGTALAGTGTTADTFGMLDGTFCGLKIIKTHNSFLFCASSVSNRECGYDNLDFLDSD